MKKRAVCVTVLLAAVLVTAALADDYTWAPFGGTGAVFQTASNWSPVGVPGEGDKVLFNAAGTNAVVFAGDATNTQATIGSAGGTVASFDLAGKTWRLGSLAFTGTSTVRLGGGTAEVASAVTTLGTNRRLVLESGRAYFTNGITLLTGGAVEVYGGNHESCGLLLTVPPAGGFSFRMTNGAYTIGNVKDFYLSDDARMSLEGGVFKTAVGARHDVYGGSVIDVRTNASLIFQNNVAFSRTSKKTATLNILGGTVTAAGGMVIATPAAGGRFCSTGIVQLADGEFAVSAGKTLFVGSEASYYGTNSTGILRQSGGRFSAPGTVFVGSFLAGRGVYELTGGSALCGTVIVGGYQTATGELNIANGMLAVGSGLYLGFYTNAVGSVTLTGGELSVSNDLYVGYAAGSRGRLVVDAPSVYVKTALRVGANGSSGELVVRPNGVCSAQNVILTNLGVPPLVRFEAGAGGFGTLVARDGVTIGTGSRLEVDTTAYHGDAVWTKLIDCVGRVTSFAAGDITVTGFGTVRQDVGADIWLYRPRGTLIRVQ